MSGKLDFKGFPYPVVQPTFTMDIARMANLDHSKVTKLVFHHTGGRDHDSSAADTNNYHMNHQGWAGIGYHAQIRWSGAFELGRPFTKRGVHASAVNAVSFGICMSGNFEIGNIMDRPNQYWSGVAVAKVFVKAFPDIEIVRHKDVGTTLCNGSLFPWEQFLKDIYREDTMAKYHIVKSGDRFSRIATANKMTETELEKLNPHIPNTGKIYAEHGGDIVWLSQPNATEIEYGKVRRELILLKINGVSQEEIDRLEARLAEEVARGDQLAAQASELKSAGKAIYGSALWLKFLDS